MIEVEIKIAGVGNDGSILVRIDDVKSVINSYQERIKELEEFAIWMTGCGYDFTQHPHFNEQRDKLLIAKPQPPEVK